MKFSRDAYSGRKLFPDLATPINCRLKVQREFPLLAKIIINKIAKYGTISLSQNIL